MTQDELKEILQYDPKTGLFVWLKNRRNVKAGQIAGGLNNKGYFRIRIDGRFHYSHRLAFLYMEGMLPSEHVDHADRNSTNNAWNNLRLASRRQNRANSKPNKNNKLGIKGVSQRHRRYRASLNTVDKALIVGSFATAREAGDAYAAAARAAFGDFANF